MAKNETKRWEQHPDMEPRNLMREYNPETWDPDADPDEAHSSGTVNIWDPIEGEGYDEPGHWADRDPDMDADHARRLALRGEFDGVEVLPLLGSNMSGVPTEGVQGSYSHVIRLDEPCPQCDQEYGVHHCHTTMGGVHSERCLICEHELMAP